MTGRTDRLHNVVFIHEAARSLDQRDDLLCERMRPVTLDHFREEIV
jgi:hypothetical protein